MQNDPKRALVIVFDGVEEIEALATVDILRRAAIEVTMASVTGTTTITGRNGIAFRADAALELVENDRFDLVVLPGGPGVLKLAGNAQVADVLKRHNARKGEIAAICAAPKILATNGLLNNRLATCHASVRDDIPNLSESPVVEDRNIVTSQGAGTAVEFALTLVKRLCGDDRARQIRDSIHA